MFCVNCGGALEAGATTACVSCGNINPPTISGADVGRLIKEASTDAVGAIRLVAVDPIGGLASAFAMLGERRGRAAGIAFGVAFAIIAAIASLVAARHGGFQGNVQMLLAVFIVALAPFVALAATSTAARKAFRTGTTAGADLFTAGVALQPFGLFLMLAAILGIDNYQAVLILSLFAWTYIVCILFAGCTRLVQIQERFAPPVLAAMLLAAIWLTKIVAASFLGSGPFARFFN